MTQLLVDTIMFTYNSIYVVNVWITYKTRSRSIKLQRSTVTITIAQGSIQIIKVIRHVKKKGLK